MITIRCNNRNNNSFAMLAEKKTNKKRFNKNVPSFKVSNSQPSGSWKSKLRINNSEIKELYDNNMLRFNNSRKRNIKSYKPRGRVLTRSCAYCHDEEHIHHIRDCPILAEKNKRKKEMKKKENEVKCIIARKRLEQRIEEERIRFNNRVIESNKVESDEDSSSDEEEDFTQINNALKNGNITLRNKSKRKVSFKDDNKNLMKPPCSEKVFEKMEPPSQISVITENKEDEDYLKSKRTNNAWKSKQQVLKENNGNSSSYQMQLLIDANKKVLSQNISWGDVAMDEDESSCDDESDDESDNESDNENANEYDFMGRPTTDNSAW
tara:strand:- start:49 stop:1014 length:966 start_codon:yes stop_codon:yes gene_type:complete